MLRYGLLGGGMMGQEHLQNLALIPDTLVTAIVEPNDKMQARCARLAPQAVFYPDLDQLLKVDLDALVIATPNYQHAGQLLSIFKQRPDLPILVEKPLVTREEDILRIRSAAEAHQAPVWVAMEYRYMPPLVEFRQQLGRVGDLQSLSIREHRFPFLQKVDDWNRFNRNSGGTMVEKCCHFFDLFRLLLDEEVQYIHGSAGQNVNHLNESYNNEVPDIIDNAFVTMDFKSGRRAMLDLNMFAEGSEYQEEICALGNQAKLECLVPGPEITWPKDRPLPEAKVVFSPRHPRGPEQKVVTVDADIMAAGSHHGSTFYEHLGFKAAMESNAPVEVTVSDGLKAVALGLAAQLSAERHQVVEMTNDGFAFQLVS
ncbi:MAG: Gfo/Idh/MocA family protein [Pseudomonadales bacterium]